MIQLVCLIVGIVALVRGKLAMTKHKELRGKPLYLAATLLIVPLPISFLFGLVYGAMVATSGGNVDTESPVFMIMAVGISWLPIVAAFIIGFTASVPKLAPNTPVSHGFEVQPMQNAGYPQQPGMPNYPQQPYPPASGQPPFPPQR